MGTVFTGYSPRTYGYLLDMWPLSLDISRAPLDIYWICGTFHWIFPAHHWISTGYEVTFTGYFPRTTGYLLDMKLLFTGYFPRTAGYLLDMWPLSLDIYWIWGLFHWIFTAYQLDISRAGTGYLVRISTEYPEKLFPDHWIRLLQDTHLCTNQMPSC